MTIYDFITSINDTDNIVFTLFDCNTESLVNVLVDDDHKTKLQDMELLYSKYSDCELGSMDMWIENGQIHIEFNIEIDEEDFEDEEI